MSRRLEVTVPNDWSPPVRHILQEQCNFTSKSGKPHMIVELPGTENTIFWVTIPGPAVSGALEVLRKNGIGTIIGRITLSSIDYMKPDLTKPLVKADLTTENMQAEVKVATAVPLKGLQAFQKARKTTEEMYNEISNGANMTINTWMNLVGASFMAAGGLTTNVLVFTVAAMLVSPIMGPILGMVMGYRVADWPLFKTGFINEMKMALAVFLVGCACGTVLGDVGNTYNWPNDQMMSKGQGFNLVISIIVSAAAGMVLGVSLTASGGNALVGTAISAGLLPPLVNAGMLMSYATVYCKGPKKDLFIATGWYSVLFYFTHVITIVFVANLIFWLKDIDPRFREGEDSSFQDIPSLVEHKRRLESEGKAYTEREKAGFFIEHIKEDLKKDFKNVTGKIKGLFTGETEVDEDEHDETAGDLESDTKKSKLRKRKSKARMRGAFYLGGKPSYLDVTDDEDEDDEEDHSAADDSHAEGVKEGVDELQAEYPNKHVKGVFSPIPSPSKMTVNPMYSKAHPGQQTAPPSIYKQRVTAFYQKYNPSKMDALPEILQRYQGKEEELLRKLHKQYNVAYVSTSSSDVAPRVATNV